MPVPAGPTSTSSCLVEVASARTASAWSMARRRPPGLAAAAVSVRSTRGSGTLGAPCRGVCLEESFLGVEQRGVRVAGFAVSGEDAGPVGAAQLRRPHLDRVVGVEADAGRRARGRGRGRAARPGRWWRPSAVRGSPGRRRTARSRRSRSSVGRITSASAASASRCAVASPTQSARSRRVRLPGQRRVDHVFGSRAGDPAGGVGPPADQLASDRAGSSPAGSSGSRSAAAGSPRSAGRSPAVPQVEVGDRVLHRRRRRRRSGWRTRPAPGRRCRRSRRRGSGARRGPAIDQPTGSRAARWSASRSSYSSEANTVAWYSALESTDRHTPCVVADLVRDHDVGVQIRVTGTGVPVFERRREHPGDRDLGAARRGPCG